ncbi:MAG: recombinase family protein [Agathobacter sp.]
MLRAVIYCRTSTDEDVQLNSLENQVRDARQCVEHNGWVLVDTYVESRSGTTANRNEYTRMYDDMMQDKFDIIVTKSIDRLNRSAKNWYLFLDRLVTEGKKLYFYMEAKFHTPDDALISGIKAIMAEEYSRELSRKINHAHSKRQKNNGNVILTKNTYGYKKLPDKSVVLVEEEADIKKRMYELCAAGFGCRTISTILANEGIFNRKGKPFTDSSILRIIRNPLNMGTAVMGKYHFNFDTKKVIRRPSKEWYVYPNKVPPTVSEELWEIANRNIDLRSDAKKGLTLSERGKNPGKFQLSGKIVCGLCGNPYYRQFRRQNVNGDRIYDWKCKTYLETGRNTEKLDRPKLKKVNLEAVAGCDNVHLEEENLNDLLQEIVEKNYKADKENIIRNMLKLLKSVLKTKDYQLEIDSAKRQMEQLQNKQNVLVDKLLSGVVSDEIFKNKQDEIGEKIANIKTKLNSLEQKKVQGSVLTNRMGIIEKKLREGNLVEKATVAGMLEEIDKIVVYPTYMEIYFSLDKMVGISNIESDDCIENKMRIEYGNRFNYRLMKVEEREVIVDMMRENPKITAKIIAEKLGISLSGANYKIKALKNAGRIEYNGKGGHGTWSVCEEEEVKED